LAAVDDPAALVLRPDMRAIVRGPDRLFAARAVAARVTGGFHRFNQRVIEERYKPIHWVLAGRVPVGYSAVDLQSLAAAGQAWLDRAGVKPGDVVVNLLRPGPSVAYWQLVLGCRRARISAMHATVEDLRPSVLVGSADDLAAASFDGVRLAICVGHPDETVEARSAAGGVPVVGAWAPVGVRAVWSECKTGAGLGYHAWAQDVVEEGPEGELLWTGVRWRGSAVLRLRTGWEAAIDRDPCPACGASTPRIRPEVARPEAILAADPDVLAWEIGQHPTGPIVSLRTDAPVEPLVRRLDRHLHAAQYVVPAVSGGGSAPGDPAWSPGYRPTPPPR
jgi:hypothetical protein